MNLTHIKFFKLNNNSKQWLLYDFECLNIVIKN